MKNTGNRLRPALVTLLTLASISVAQAKNDRAADVQLAIDWNQLVNDISYAEDQWFTLKGARAHAMMHIAMHDALNTINPRYESYAYGVDPDDQRRTDPIAAAATAAFEVLVHEYPDQRANLELLRDHWLGQVRGRQPAERGTTLGKAAAVAILAQRVGDNWDASGSYTFQPPAPGVYQTYPPFGTPPGPGFVFGPGWALARPFAMASQSQFRPGPPPAVSSSEYAAAFNEVKELGELNSPSRPADQTHSAFFWKEFAEGVGNRLARQLAASGDLDLWEATRMFALLNIGIFDGYVNTMEAKYYYNFWRPVTAIHQANTDGNPLTVANPVWVNLDQFTPPIPSYSSANSTAHAAALTVLGQTFGDAYFFIVETTTAPASGLPRALFPVSPRPPSRPASPGSISDTTFVLILKWASPQARPYPIMRPPNSSNRDDLILKT